MRNRIFKCFVIVFLTIIATELAAQMYYRSIPSTPFNVNTEIKQLEPKPFNTEIKQIEPKPFNTEIKQLEPKPFNTEIKQIEPKPFNTEIKQLEPKPFNTEIKQIEPYNETSLIERLYDQEMLQDIAREAAEAHRLTNSPTLPPIKRWRSDVNEAIERGGLRLPGVPGTFNPFFEDIGAVDDKAPVGVAPKRTSKGPFDVKKQSTERFDVRESRGTNWFLDL